MQGLRLLITSLHVIAASEVGDNKKIRTSRRVKDFMLYEKRDQDEVTELFFRLFFQYGVLVYYIEGFGKLTSTRNILKLFMER